MTSPQAAGPVAHRGRPGGLYKASLADQGALLAGATEADGFDTDARFNLFKGASADEASQKAVLDSIADSDAKGAVRDALATPARLDLDTIGDRAVAAGVGGKIAASPGTTTRNTATVLADLHEVEDRQFDQLIGDARASNSSAQRSAKLFLIAGLVVVLGAAGAAIFLGRRITGPLARLTDAANHLSTEQMPASSRR